MMLMGGWALALCVVAIAFWPSKTGVPRPTPTGGDGQEPANQTAAPRTDMGQPGIAAITAVHRSLKAKNPSYNGRGKFQQSAGRIVVADLSGTGIGDPSPLRAFPLEALDLSENPIADLTALSGMGLRRLALEATKVTDLAPLKGMKLTGLYLNRTRIRDLTALRGMPLELLNLYETDVTDLSPLQDMPLKSLWLNGTKVRDLTPLAQCPLTSLTLVETPVTDLYPLAGSTTLRRLHIGQSAVTDLTALKGMKLTRLVFAPRRIRKGIEVVRKMDSIREIGSKLDNMMPPKEFWALSDEGKFK